MFPPIVNFRRTLTPVSMAKRFKEKRSVFPCRVSKPKVLQLCSTGLLGQRDLLPLQTLRYGPLRDHKGPAPADSSFRATAGTVQMALQCVRPSVPPGPAVK